MRPDRVIWERLGRNGRRASAPNGPQLGPREGQGTSPVVVAAGAAAVGALLAKLIDWRSHAHPRR